MLEKCFYEAALSCQERRLRTIFCKDTKSVAQTALIQRKKTEKYLDPFSAQS